ncbi:MAG: TetR/AcrR family transcriptional regulator [Pseudomonadota bacterium]
MSSDLPATRERILKAAVRMLEEHGGRGVRMADIAKATGISRQAVYLHFTSRSELLIAATLYKGDLLDVDARLAPSRAATVGVERLDRYIEFWGDYIPEFYPVAKALMLAQDTDTAAAEAWRDRMRAMKEGCRAAIDALHADGTLSPDWSRPKATDALWAMLSVPAWEALTLDCGWSTKEYTRRMKSIARQSFTVGV